MPDNPSTKLVINDAEHNVVIPLRGEAEAVTLEEPSLAQFAKMHDLILAADQALPPLPELSDDPTRAELTKFADVNRDRAVVQYSAESPHGLALIQIISLLTGTDVTMDDLYGWAGNPQTVNRILRHFSDPFGGPGA